MSSLASSKLTNGTKRPISSAPSPSANSTSSKTNDSPSKRQKRDRDAVKDHASPTPAALAQAQAASSFGSHMLTNLSYAVQRLKEKGQPVVLREILSHLNLDKMAEPDKIKFARLMQNHDRVTWTPDRSMKGEQYYLGGKYEHSAIIPGVKDKTSLLAYLQRKVDKSPLSVKDLKDGWEDCDQAIKELEDQHKILVVRTKKDSQAKYIWEDTPQLNHSVDAEFVNMWHKVEVPSLDDIVRKLSAVGQKPASEDPRLKKVETPKTGPKKRKSARPLKNQSNQHMAHLLKDYSHLKR
ncbi:hypothetical protein F4778DRAFT_764218 [Xylariomycetidae sp. FL2044]|nr:hypothetical protein F4778DRAFT_764218 [Xylariomycetidae sp. FL2044]